MHYLLYLNIQQSQVEYLRIDCKDLFQIDTVRQLKRYEDGFPDRKLHRSGDSQATLGMEGKCLPNPRRNCVWCFAFDVHHSIRTVWTRVKQMTVTTLISIINNTNIVIEVVGDPYMHLQVGLISSVFCTPEGSCH